MLSTMKRTIVLGCLVLLACGGSEQASPESVPPASPPAIEPAPPVAVEPAPVAVEPASIAPTIVEGEWTGGSSGGPIQSSLTWRFHGSSYGMDGYPAIGENGRLAITSDVANADGSRSVAVHFSASRQCDGPCAPGAGQPREDRDVPMVLSADGRSLTFGGITYTHLPAADS